MQILCPTCGRNSNTSYKRKQKRLDKSIRRHKRPLLYDNLFANVIKPHEHMPIVTMNLKCEFSPMVAKAKKKKKKKLVHPARGLSQAFVPAPRSSSDRKDNKNPEKKTPVSGPHRSVKSGIEVAQ